MRKATLWVGVFVLVWFSCGPAPAEKEGGEEPEALEVVRMKVGPTSLTQANKLERPIPEVPFGEPFIVEVEWDSETRPDQSLTLKDFVAVVLDERGEPLWRPAAGELRLEIRDEPKIGSPVENGVMFSRPESGDPVGAILVLYGAEGVTYSDGKTLVLFTVELVTEQGETVLFDPPWAKKGKR
jgi:hypothetical protein